MMPGFFSIPALLRQFIFFCGVGSVNTIVTLLIILGLTHYAIAGNIVANIAGYAVGLCIGFVLHRAITFRAHAKTGRLHRQALKFLIIFCIGYAVQLGCLVIMTEYWHWEAFLSQIIACMIYVAISFTGNRFATFAESSV